MCYDVASGLRTLIKYAKHRHDDPKYISALEKKLEEWITEISSHHHVSGFSHPKLMVFTNEKPLEPQAFVWGLIPAWVKDIKTAMTLYNQTLNARAETIFDKPSFRDSAKNKRCLIYLDAFYEHHHANGKTYPFRIVAKDGAPIAVAGLWDEWINKKTGEIISTVSIVTCQANSTMQKIHNNPKLTEPRMPVILSKDKQDKWLAKCTNENDKEDILQLCVPYPDTLLRYYTVPRIKGKAAVGNTIEAESEYTYPELQKFSDSLPK